MIEGDEAFSSPSIHVCPSQAIRVSIDDPDFLEKSYQRIRAHVKFD